VLSPLSARSEICAWEVGEAIRLGKRIIPVLSRPLESAIPPPQLADLDYIFFYEEPRSPGSGFGTGLLALVTALNTDLDWLREHTCYLQRATEWDAGRRLANRPLSGVDTATAKAWAASRPKAAPEPTAVHLDFIRASALQHDDAVFAATFDATGERVVTASSDKTAGIWDARTGKPIGEPLRHDDAVRVATFDAKGERVITASYDKTAQIWDARTGDPIREPLHHDGPIWAATFDAKGEHLVIASNDRTARIWDAPPAVGQALLDHVRATLGPSAPDPLKIPEQPQSFVSVIRRGFNIMWTRVTAVLT
jgi:WD domain, G-beta repeat